VSEQWLLFLGRFHPALVHLPIGLVLLVGVLELLARTRRFRHANAGIGYILALAVPGALGSAIAGWLLAAAGGYEGDTLEWHRWSGVATTVLLSAAALLHQVNLLRAYRATLILTLLALLLAGHYGGSLTHGAGYLLEHAPVPLKKLFRHGGDPLTAPSPEAEAYATLIQPVFNQYCVSCHGADKSKAGLRLDSHAAVMKGGEHGAVVVRAKAAESLLLQRMHLPVEDDDHMPPDGKPQPGAAEIRLLEWWVSLGAPEREQIKNLPRP
jgi:uncharacterized membrane protein